MPADVSKTEAVQSEINKKIISQPVEKMNIRLDSSGGGEKAGIDSGGHALDGSQYLGIIEEQIYAEQRPTPEEQKPWRIFHQHPGRKEGAEQQRQGDAE